MRTRSQTQTAVASSPVTHILCLPTELLVHILVSVPLVFHIANAAAVCKELKKAVAEALKQRPYSSEPIVLEDHENVVSAVGATPNAMVLVGSLGNSVTLWSADGRQLGGEQHPQPPKQGQAISAKRLIRWCSRCWRGSFRL